MQRPCCKGPDRRYPTHDFGPNAAPSPPPPKNLLSDLARLRREARSARHAYWFPLVLFGLLTCASVPFYVSSDVTQTAQDWPSCGSPRRPTAARRPSWPAATGSSLAWYWALALVAGYLLTYAWYRRHQRRTGIRTPARAFTVTGIVLAAAGLPRPAARRPTCRSGSGPVLAARRGPVGARHVRVPDRRGPAGARLGRAEPVRSRSSRWPTPAPRCWPACTTWRTCCTGPGLEPRLRQRQRPADDAAERAAARVMLLVAGGRGVPGAARPRPAGHEPPGPAASRSGPPAPRRWRAPPRIPTNGLDDTVHQRHRLGILTITAEARAEFGYLRDASTSPPATCRGT